VNVSPGPSVLVIAIDASPSPDLLRIALHHGWPVHQATSASAALAEVLRVRPAVAIVQVAHSAGEDLALIHLLRTGSRPVLLVVVALTHRDEIERAVRAVGVESYIGGAGNAGLIDRTVTELLAQQKCTPAPVARVGRRASGEIEGLLLPYRTPPGRAAGNPPAWNAFANKPPSCDVRSV
jgi:ActR/RegA family two-component response regulator